MQRSAQRAPLTVFAGSSLVVSLGQSLPATAVPVMARDLHRLDLVAWPVGAALLASTTAGPIVARLSDRVGRLVVLRVTLALVALSGLLSGLAPSMTSLIAVRVLFGVAAGGLVTVSAVAVAETVTPSVLPRYQGTVTALTSAATVGAPFLGGLLLSFASWRWVFIATCPLPLMVMWLSRRLPEGSRSQPLPTDAVAGLLLFASTGALLWGVGAWSVNLRVALGCVAAGVLGALALVVRERKARYPILPPELFSDALFARCWVLSALTGALLFSVPLQLQLYLQLGRALSPARAGLYAIPLFAAVAVMSTGYGRLSRGDRVGRRLLCGGGLLAAGVVLFGETALTSGTFVAPALVLVGAGLGAILPAIGTVVQLGADRASMTRAVSVMQITRTLGGAVGVTVTGSLFAVPSAGPAGSFAFLTVLSLASVAVALPLRERVIERLVPRHRR